MIILDLIARYLIIGLFAYLVKIEIKEKSIIELFKD